MSFGVPDVDQLARAGAQAFSAHPLTSNGNMRSGVSLSIVGKWQDFAMRASLRQRAISGSPYLNEFDLLFST